MVVRNYYLKTYAVTYKAVVRDEAKGFLLGFTVDGSKWSGNSTG